MFCVVSRHSADARKSRSTPCTIFDDPASRTGPRSRPFTWCKKAGHADISTTKKYYLSFQEEDLKAAKKAQQDLVGGLKEKATDPKLTHKQQKRSFPKRKIFGEGTQPPEEKKVA
jgi:hypothetical protein